MIVWREKDLSSLKEQTRISRVNIALFSKDLAALKPASSRSPRPPSRECASRLPGFAQAWELAVRQATADQDAAESGLTKLIRKVLPEFASGR